MSVTPSINPDLPASEWSGEQIEAYCRESAEELAAIKEIEAGKDSPYLKNSSEKPAEHVGKVRIN